MNLQVGKRYERTLSVVDIMGTNNDRYVTLKDSRGTEFSWYTARFTSLFQNIEENRDKKYRMSFTVENIYEGVVSIIRPRLFEVV